MENFWNYSLIHCHFLHTFLPKVFVNHLLLDWRSARPSGGNDDEGSHVILDVVTSPYWLTEICLAKHFYQRTPSHLVILPDEGFWSANWWFSMPNSGENMHWWYTYVRGLVAKVVENYGPASNENSIIASTQKNPALSTQWAARVVTYLCGTKKNHAYLATHCQIQRTTDCRVVSRVAGKFEEGLRDTEG